MKITVLKVGLIVLLCLISYYIGWGKGQADTYYKLEHSPSLESLYSK